MAISSYAYPLLMAAALMPAAASASDTQKVVVQGKRNPSEIVIKGVRAPSDWVRIESRHLIVYSNTDPDQALRLVDNLEKLDYVLRLYLKPFLLPEDGAPKFTLYFQRGSSWAPGIGEHADTAASLVDSCAAATQAFTFDADRIWKLKDSDLPDTDVSYTLVWNQIAYAGAFLKRQTDIRGPEWFVSGFAAYFGGLQFGDTQMLVGRAAGTSYDLLKDIDNGRERRLMFEDVLHGGGKKRPVGFYPQWEFLGRSFNLVHYLLSSPENRDKMASYLEQVNNGGDAADAFAAIFGLQGAAVDMAMSRYRREALKAYRVDVPGLPKAKTELTHLSRIEGEFVLDNATLKTCPAPADGKALLEHVGAAAVKAPAVAFAQMTLSRAQVEWGDPRDAIGYLAHAVENDPSNPEAHYLLGLAHARLAENAADGADRQALLAAARASLTQAAILAPGMPEVQYALFRIEVLGAEPGEQGVSKAIEAWRYGHDVPAFARAAALAYAWLGDSAGAYRAFNALVRDERDPQDGTWAAAWLGRLQTGVPRDELLAAMRREKPAPPGYRQWEVNLR